MSLKPFIGFAPAPPPERPPIIEVAEGEKLFLRHRESRVVFCIRLIGGQPQVEFIGHDPY